MTKDRQQEPRSGKPLEPYIAGQDEPSGTAIGEGWSGSPGARPEGRTGEQSPESLEQARERRPVYGYYYASATRRMSRQRQGGPGQGEWSEPGGGPYGARAGGSRGEGGLEGPRHGAGPYPYTAADATAGKTRRGRSEEGWRKWGDGGRGRFGETTEGREFGAPGVERDDEELWSRDAWGRRGERARIASRPWDRGWDRAPGERGELGSREGYGYGYGRGRSGRRVEVVSEPEADEGRWVEPEWRGRDRERGQERWPTRWQREPLTAGEVMTRQIKAVTKRSSLQNVAEIMKDESCGIVPVVDEGHKLLGLVTDRDIVIRTLAEGRSPGEVAVEDIMSDDVEAVRQDEEIAEVVELMGRKQIRRVPVVDPDDRLVGIISMGDIATRADYDEDLQDALERISARRSFWSRLWS